MCSWWREGERIGNYLDLNISDMEIDGEGWYSEY